MVDSAGEVLVSGGLAGKGIVSVSNTPADKAAMRNFCITQLNEGVTPGLRQFQFRFRPRGFVVDAEDELDIRMHVGIANFTNELAGRPVFGLELVFPLPFLEPGLGLLTLKRPACRRFQ